MEPKVLRPTKKKIDLKGKMLYREFDQGWSTIRLKKEILAEFGELKEKRSVFSYNLQFFWDYKELEKELGKIKKENRPLPMLLYIIKEAEAR